MNYELFSKNVVCVICNAFTVEHIIENHLDTDPFQSIDGYRRKLEERAEPRAECVAVAAGNGQ